MNEKLKQDGIAPDSPFDCLAEEYDRWFEDSPVFGSELACLQKLETELPAPRLEVGVGPGRFAECLGIGFGLDPAFNALKLAQKRKIAVCRAVGETLPLRDAILGTLYLLFVLCFVADRRLVLGEASRVLRPGGMLVVGMVPQASRWGQAILEKKKEGHLFYRSVGLLEVKEATSLLEEAGFSIVETRSALLDGPREFTGREKSRSGCIDGAGFAVLVGRKRSCL